MRYPLPYAFARGNQLLLEDDGEQLVLWHSGVPSRSAWSEVLRKHPVGTLQQLDPPALAQRISAAYAQGESSAATVVSEVQNDADLSRMMQELPAVEDLLETSDDAPIIRMLNALLTQAARDGASDIHIEPYERHSSVRFRVDGTLREVVQPNRALHAALISRLKIMAELDIAEKRLPQDGRISLRIGTRAVDVRVSTLPSAHGERAVLRLLDKSGGKLSLESVGMTGETLRRFLDLIAQPHGIILVSGPTGSGKTTTLYSTLRQLATDEVNVCTIEDPIEMIQPAFNQTQVQPLIDLNFAEGLRALMRQDPDIIMVGEIRDLETAEMAIQAALTGHLVFSTLHTNDAASAITRLVDLGVAPYLIGATVIGVLAQRLVRTLCVACKQPDDSVTRETLQEVIKPWRLNGGVRPCKPVGCLECRMTGYRGRAGLYELLTVSDAAQSCIHPQPDGARLRQQALKDGLRSLRLAGVMKIAEGVTTLDEVLRCTPAWD